jgi:Ni/Fe-hydrogenase subunit HybB-like protein
MEVSNFLFEKVNWRRAFRVTHAITVPLVITGVILSTLHQSSLGSLFLIVPYKLHALWYSPWLPVFFFNSAMALGCAMVIVESFISSKVFKKELELSILTNLSRALVVILMVYGIARAIDINDRNAWNLIFQPGFEHFMFLAEVTLSIIGPIVLLLIPRVRINRSGLFISALMVVTGFILNRFNVSMTGLIRAADTKYIPSWMEISVTFAIVTLGLVLFSLAVKYLDIFKDAKPCLSQGQTCSDNPSCCLPTPLWLLIFSFWTFSLTTIVKGVIDFYHFQPGV